MKRITAALLTFSLLICLTVCDSESESGQVQESLPPRPTLSHPAEPEDGWILDESGTFSYLEYTPQKDIELYFETRVGCPDNMVLYKKMVSSIEMYGYMDIEFNILTDPVYERPNIFQFGYTFTFNNRIWEIIDHNFSKVNIGNERYIISGNEILQIDWLGYPVKEPDLIVVEDVEEYLVPCAITHDPESGAELLSPIYGYKTLTNYHNADIKEDEGFAIEPQYNRAYLFSDGMAGVLLDGKFGFIDTDGNLVIEFKYDSIVQNFQDGAALVYINDDSGKEPIKGTCIIDKEGNELTGFYGGYNIFSENFVVMNIDMGKSNYYDTEGNRLNSNDYSWAEPFNEGYALVYTREGSYFIDTSGNHINSTAYRQARSFSNGLAAVNVNGAWAYIYGDNSYAFEPQFAVASDFSQGYALVKNSAYDTGVVIDQTGNRYLEDLELTLLTVFNGQGCALGKKIEATQNGAVETFYIIKIENFEN